MPVVAVRSNNPTMVIGNVGLREPTISEFNFAPRFSDAPSKLISVDILNPDLIDLSGIDIGLIPADEPASGGPSNIQAHFHQTNDYQTALKLIGFEYGATLAGSALRP